jgi:hypothetical protein
VVAVAGLAAGADRRREACITIGLCHETDFMGAMLTSVQRQQKLLVLTARLVDPVSSARDTTLGPLTVATTRQTVILPATVSYVLDLSSLTATDLAWDEAGRTLTVRRPQVAVLAPTIDWPMAKVYEDGGWATAVTDVSANLKRDNEAKAPARFLALARTPDLMAMANGAADDALATSFRMPLVAAGFVDARVIVTR